MAAKSTVDQSIVPILKEADALIQMRRLPQLRPDRERGSGCRGFGLTCGCGRGSVGSCRSGDRRGVCRVSSAVASRHSNRNAGRCGRDAEVAIDLAEGEAGGIGNRGYALALLGHLLVLRTVGKTLGFVSILSLR